MARRKGARRNDGVVRLFYEGGGDGEGGGRREEGGEDGAEMRARVGMADDRTWTTEGKQGEVFLARC
jgi:hypothetical protein